MSNDVYASTTVSNPKSSIWLGHASDYLDKSRFFLKIAEVLLSLVAFILEETVTSCISCSPLYFFEFVSCTAFLFTALLFVLLATTLHQKVGIRCWSRLDLVYTAVIAVLFLISSIAFVSDNGRTSVESTAVVFGFLSTAVFLMDVGFFLRNNGNPFKTQQAPPTSNGGVTQPEAEKLNGDASGAP